MSSSEPKGLKELTKALKKFPDNIQKNVMVGAIRAGAKPIIKRAKELVPVESGLLKKSIRVRKRRVPKGSTEIKFSVHAGGEVKSFGTRAYHAHLIEFGTSKMSPKPFMRPAFEQEGENSISYVKEYMKKRIPKEIDKAKR